MPNQITITIDTRILLGVVLVVAALGLLVLIRQIPDLRRYRRMQVMSRDWRKRPAEPTPGSGRRGRPGRTSPPPRPQEVEPAAPRGARKSDPTRAR